jgi:hypothetical protein
MNIKAKKISKIANHVCGNYAYSLEIHSVQFSTSFLLEITYDIEQRMLFLSGVRLSNEVRHVFV